jgi:hypothetical protein
LPHDAFAHTDPGAVVRLEVRTATGDPLPAWLRFDPNTGMFRGTPPDGRPVFLDLIVIARDEEGREAQLEFEIEFGVKGDEQKEATAAEQDAPPVRTDLSRVADAEESDEEAAVAEGEEAPNAERAKVKAATQQLKRGSVPFSEQIRAAKAGRDPVLARVLADKDRREQPRGPKS